MSDEWETTKRLNPADPADNKGFDLSKQYTNLEVYLIALTKMK